MADKEELRNMVNAVINDESEQAQVHFKNYVTAKMRDIVSPPSETEATDKADEESNDE